MSKKNLRFLILPIAILCAYSPLFNGFFQQDEWYSFTWYVTHRNLNFIEKLKFLFAPSVGHYNPFTNSLQYSLLTYWGMNYTNFAILGIILHLLVTVALFFLARAFFKGNNLLAFLSTLLFGLFASPYQGVSWVIADMSTLISTFLGLISVILFLKFTEHKKNNYLIWSLIVLVFSLLFKEITIGLFVFYLVYYFLVFRKKPVFKHVLLICFFGGLYFLFRVSMIFAPNTTGDQLVTQSQSMSKILYNFLTLPIKSISQIIFPPEFMKSVAFNIARYFPNKISGGFGSPQFESFAVKRIMEFINIFTGLIIIFTSIFVVKKTKKIKYKEIIFLGLGWTIVNSFIFSFAPENPGIIYVVDSRNLYFASIGISLFIVTFLDLVSGKKSAWTILFFLPILIFNIYWLNNNLTMYTEMGSIRRSILEQIKDYYKVLPNKAIFYITSDSSYYGLPESEKILPFQSGLGQTLLVWYYPTENFPADFFKNKFLWDITTEGYKEIDGQGFGYFRNYELLKKTIRDYNVPINSVYAFTWTSKENKLNNITQKTREKLTKNEKIQ